MTQPRAAYPCYPSGNEPPLPSADALPKDVPTLKSMILELLVTLRQQGRDLTEAQQRIDLLLRRLYGPRAERFNPDQRVLFPELLAEREQAGADASIPTEQDRPEPAPKSPPAKKRCRLHMLDRVQTFAQSVRKRLIADGDTGYGGLLNVYHTVRGYEKAGAAVIQLEDQQVPKKCGHTPNRHVFPVEEMVSKIKVACDARSSDDFLILARTDALTSFDVDEAIRRGQPFDPFRPDTLASNGPLHPVMLRALSQGKLGDSSVG